MGSQERQELIGQAIEAWDYVFDNPELDDEHTIDIVWEIEAEDENPIADLLDRGLSKNDVAVAGAVLLIEAGFTLNPWELRTDTDSPWQYGKKCETN